MGLDGNGQGPSEAAEVLDLLQATIPEAVELISAPQGDATVMIRPESLRSVMEFLKNDPRLQFNLLVDITAVDYLGRKPRFEVVYHLLSIGHKRRLRIKLRLDGNDPAVESMAGLWGSADWLEREVWDMFGIRFAGHPNLKRILMYEEFEGHPLRKDYPMRKRQPLIGPKS
jgi:NADH-quinone oxidoreductase subunit C